MAFSFNSDLLLGDADNEVAKHGFPELYDVLRDEELKAEFRPRDREANDAKKRSRFAGTLAVVLGFLALSAAASEPIVGAEEGTRKLIAGLAGFLGITSVLIGFVGVIFRSRKERWLRARWCTERLRQLHFQTLLADFPLTLNASQSTVAGKAYLGQRSEFRCECK